MATRLPAKLVTSTPGETAVLVNGETLQFWTAPRKLTPQVVDRILRPYHPEDRALWIKQCQECQGYFIGRYAAQVCGETCHTKRRRRQVNANNAKRNRHVYRDEDRDCCQCGRPFMPSRSDAKYCSAACRQAAYRKRV